MDRVDRKVEKGVKGATFSIVLRGYDKRQVEERLRILGAELVVANNALQAAQQRAAMLADEVSRARSAGDPQLDSHFGARVEKILMLAEQQAREIRSQADAAAAAVVEQAHVEAAQLMAQARAEANRLVTTATERAQQRERASAHELHQLSRLHDEINADLYRAKEVLDRLFGGARPALRAATGTSPATPSPGAKRPTDSAEDRRQARTV